MQVERADALQQRSTCGTFPADTATSHDAASTRSIATTHATATANVAAAITDT